MKICSPLPGLSRRIIKLSINYVTKCGFEFSKKVMIPTDFKRFTIA